MGRRLISNKERSIPVSITIKNWEFLNQHKVRGKKLDDVITMIIKYWSTIKELKEDGEFFASEYYESLKSIKRYREGLEDLAKDIEDNQIKARIYSILGYEYEDGEKRN